MSSGVSNEYTTALLSKDSRGHQFRLQPSPSPLPSSPPPPYSALERDGERAALVLFLFRCVAFRFVSFCTAFSLFFVCREHKRTRRQCVSVRPFGDGLSAAAAGSSAAPVERSPDAVPATRASVLPPVRKLQSRTRHGAGGDIGASAATYLHRNERGGCWSRCEP